MKVAIISTHGVGDGLVYLVLANALANAGHEVLFFSPPLAILQPCFSKVTMCSYENEPDIIEQCQSIDKVFICSRGFLAQYQQAEAKVSYLPGFANKEMAKVNQILHFCKNELGLVGEQGKANGITPCPSWQGRKYPNRVVLHPTSTDARKNWPAKKYIKLSQRLLQMGFEPLIIVSPRERQEWLQLVDGKLCPAFDSLLSVAKTIYESGWMIGNDSGIGHLASSLGVPTLTIFRNASRSELWRPAWAPGTVICGAAWAKSLNLWKRLLTVRRVLQAFAELRYQCKPQEKIREAG